MTSNFFLCDYCKHWRKWRPNYTGLEGRCTITEKSGSLFGKKVMHDGVEKPTDVCEHYKGANLGSYLGNLGSYLGNLGR